MTEKGVQAPSSLSQNVVDSNKKVKTKEKESTRKNTSPKSKRSPKTNQKSKIKIKKLKIKKGALIRKMRKFPNRKKIKESIGSRQRNKSKQEIPKIVLNSQISDGNLPVRDKEEFANLSQSKIKRRVSACPQLVRDKSSSKMAEALDNLMRDRNYVNLSFSQKSLIKKPNENSLVKSSTKDLRFDPKLQTQGTTENEQGMSPHEVSFMPLQEEENKRPKSKVKVKPKKLKKNKSHILNNLSMKYDPHSLVDPDSTLHNLKKSHKNKNSFNFGNSPIDIDYTYNVVKELERLKSAKNQQFKESLFSPTNNSMFTGFGSSSHANLHARKPSKTRKEKIYGNKMMNKLFETPFSKKRKKWSKILSFFKRNTDMLVNLIPDDDPKPSIFGISRRVLTRPKSQSKYRPYSMNQNLNSPMASSGWLNQENNRPFTENIKFRAKRKSTDNQDEISFIYQKKRKSSCKGSRRQNQTPIVLNTFSINSSNNSN